MPPLYYRELGPRVEAVQHDGSVQSGQAIVDWLRTDIRVTADLLPEGYNFDPDHRYLIFGTRWTHKTVGPTDWVILSHADGEFIMVSDIKFKKSYVEERREEDEHTRGPREEGVGVGGGGARDH